MDIEISNLLDAIESNISLNAYKLNTFATNYFNSLMEKLNTCDETTINEVLDRIEIIADSSEAEASILLYSMILIQWGRFKCKSGSILLDIQHP